MRNVLLYLSERKSLQKLMLRSKLATKLSSRFVAGETLEQAIAVTGELNSRGMTVTLDHLGESVERAEQALLATSDYIAILDRIKQTGVKSGISIKLTQIGLAIDYELCRQNLERIAEAARARDSFVRIDMEASEYVEATLKLFFELFAEYKNIGAVIQSYLRRSEEDVRRLAACGAPVRLCKGAYKEPPDIAFQKKSEVDARYVHLLEILMGSNSPLAVATHDGRMIGAATQLMNSNSKREAPVEFQMLYGVRRDLQARLVGEGHRMRVYVPYGTEWYPYFMRRMAERPANLLFVLRAMTGK